MRIHGKFLCPSCAMDAEPNAFVCRHCGGNLNALGFELNKYQLVPDGDLYGIALRGRTILHSMKLSDAQSTLALFNEEKKIS